MGEEHMQAAMRMASPDTRSEGGVHTILLIVDLVINFYVD